MTDARVLPPTGRCHDCGKPVTGERRVCGQCGAKREQDGKKRRREADLAMRKAARERLAELSAGGG